MPRNHMHAHKMNVHIYIGIPSSFNVHPHFLNFSLSHSLSSFVVDFQETNLYRNIAFGEGYSW